MKPAVRDTADQIVDDLMHLQSNEERRQVLAVLGLIFCGSCGRAASELEVSVTSTASSCIHGRDRDTDMTIMGWQKALEEEKQELTKIARTLRSQYPMGRAQ